MACDTFKLIDANGVETNLADYGLYIGTTSSGLPTQTILPPIKNIYIDDISRKNGAIQQYQKLGIREIVIPVFYGRALSIVERDILKAKFLVRSPKKLIFNRLPHVYINVVSDDSIESNYIWYGENGFAEFFELKYLALDPLFYSIADSTTLPAYSEYLPAEGFHQLYYNVGMPYVEDIPDYQYTNIITTTNITLNNFGNYDYDGLIIEIQGSATNLVFTNNSNGDSFTIDEITAETIIIDGTRGQVRNISNGFETDKFSGDFILLNSGESEIEISGDTLNLDSVIFTYKYPFL